MVQTTYGTISQRTAAWAAREMLSHAEPVLVLSKFGAGKPLPSNKAETAKFRRPVPFAVNATTQLLTEGVTPTAVAMTYEDVTVTLNQYGRLVEITDKVADLIEDPVLKDSAMMVGENMAELIETVIWNTIKAGTSVIYANGTARNQVNTVLSLEDVRLAVRALRANRGMPITKILAGSEDYNTSPVEGGFVAVGHTDMEADIRNLAGFIPVAEYGSRQPLCPEELGSVESVRFVLSPVLTSFPDAGAAHGGVVKSTTGTVADVYPLVVLARESFGMVPLKGKYAIDPTVINPGQKDKSDPLGQRGYVGAKTYFNAVILNNAWMQRIEAGVSDLIP